MEKMDVVKQVVTRKFLYEVIVDALHSNGFSTEPIKGGILIDLNNGYHAKAAISICDPEKVEGWRSEYAEQMEKNAQKAAVRAEKEREKAEKAKGRAAKKNKDNADAAANDAAVDEDVLVIQSVQVIKGRVYPTFFLYLLK